MNSEWVVLFLSVLLTLMVAQYLIEGGVRARRGQGGALLVVAVLSLPAVGVVWARWRPWEGLPRESVLAAAAAAVMIVAGALLLRRAEQDREAKVGRDEVPVPVGAVQVITFGQAPESEYLRIAAVDVPPRIGWVAPHTEQAEARWDATLTRMGWHRATPWTPDPDSLPACEAIPLTVH